MCRCALFSGTRYGAGFHRSMALWRKISAPGPVRLGHGHETCRNESVNTWPVRAQRGTISLGFFVSTAGPVASRSATKCCARRSGPAGTSMARVVTSLHRHTPMVEAGGAGRRRVVASCAGVNLHHDGPNARPRSSRDNRDVAVARGSRTDCDQRGVGSSSGGPSGESPSMVRAGGPP